MHVCGEARFLSIHTPETRKSSSCLSKAEHTIIPQELKRCCGVTSTKTKLVVLILLNMADLALYLTCQTQASKDARNTR